MEKMKTQPYFGMSTHKYRTPSFHLLDLRMERKAFAPAHFHDRTHFCWVLQGCYSEKIGRRVFERLPFDVMYHPAGVSHSGTNLTGTRCLVVELTNKVVSQLQVNRSLFENPCHFRGAEINELVVRLYEEVQRPRVCSDLVVEALILEMLVFVARHNDSKDSPHIPNWLRELKDSIDSEFLTAPSLACLSETIGRNPSHVARVFRQHVGMSIGEYVRNLKVELAKKQLNGSDMPLSKIAKACGFSDSAHFSNVFRKTTGITPRQYRVGGHSD